MLLLNSFFTIADIVQQDEKTRVSVEINPQHPIFEVHFPDNPVVPGVCLIQMIRETLETIHQKKFRLTKADEIKFMNMVIPSLNPKLTLEIQPRLKSENPFAFSIIVSAEGVIFIKMKVDFAEKEG